MTMLRVPQAGDQVYFPAEYLQGDEPHIRPLVGAVAYALPDEKFTVGYWEVVIRNDHLEDESDYSLAESPTDTDFEQYTVVVSTHEDFNKHGCIWTYVEPTVDG